MTPLASDCSAANRALLDRRINAGIIDSVCYVVLQVIASGVMAVMLPESEETPWTGLVIWTLAFGSPLIVWSKLCSMDLTYGERVYGVEFVTQTSNRPSTGRFFVRTAVWWILSICFLIAPISILLMNNRQGIHGLLSGTHVRSRWEKGFCYCCGSRLDRANGNRCGECGVEIADEWFAED